MDAGGPVTDQRSCHVCGHRPGVLPVEMHGTTELWCEECASDVIDEHFRLAEDPS